MEIRTCFCGGQFEAPARKCGLAKLYCSSRCKTAAWRAVVNPERAAQKAAKDDAKQRQLYAANPEAARARVAAYRRRPGVKAHGNAMSARWRAANPDKQKAAKLRWEAQHPEHVAVYMSRYRARKRGNGGAHTVAEWRAKCAEFNHACAYCGEKKHLTRDHDLPLSRGGTDDISNIVPACRLCNSKKRTRTAEEYRALMVA